MLLKRKKKNVTNSKHAYHTTSIGFDTAGGATDSEVKVEVGAATVGAATVAAAVADLEKISSSNARPSKVYLVPSVQLEQQESFFDLH